MKTINKFLITAILTLAVTTLSHAQSHTTEHNHGHNQNARAELTFDHGKKWQSDVALRQGMQSINEAVMKNIAAFHSNKLTRTEAEKLAKHINDQVTFLVTNCKLQPQADATLHVIIGELLSGADVLLKDPQSMQGMPTLVKALMLYPEYFEHKNWKGIEH